MEQLHIRSLNESGMGDCVGAEDCGSLGFARKGAEGAESDEMAVVLSSGQHAFKMENHSTIFGLVI